MNIKSLGYIYNKLLNEFGYNISLGKKYKDTVIYNEHGQKLYSSMFKGYNNTVDCTCFLGNGLDAIFLDKDYSLGIYPNDDVSIKARRDKMYEPATYISIEDRNNETGDLNQIVFKVDEDEQSILTCILRRRDDKYLEPITMHIDQGRTSGRVTDKDNHYSIQTGTDNYLNEISVFLEENLKDILFNGNMVNELLESIRPALKALIDNLIKKWFSKIDIYIETRKLEKENIKTRYQNGIEKCDHELEIAYNNGDENIDKLKKHKSEIINQYNLTLDSCNNELEWLYQIKSDGIDTVLSEDGKTK